MIDANNKAKRPNQFAGGFLQPGTYADVEFSNVKSSIPSSITVDNLASNIVGKNPNAATPNVIKGSSMISVDFKVLWDNAYPALFISYANIKQEQANESYWYVWVTKDRCINDTGDNTPVPLPPVDEVFPTEPSFTLKSAVWDLGTVDVASVPDVAVAGPGHAASINNISNNNLCISYATAGVKNNTYALGVTNSSSTQGGRNLYTVQGANNSSLFYNLQLVSNDGVTGNNFDFPAGTTKYIALSQAASGVDKRSEMCWTPKINLFRNASTRAGVHSDTVSFIITPKA
ncbi:hypothetical protein [Serratia sp. Ag1]|uniref:hypothetical protein n=1 Tax=Serratia sp. Ag1 TaxID=1524467 RepID=UPI001267BD6B|nr:hypothetical protein [Serratia sp. Ag1]